jgi:hypothetical protein
MSKIAIGVGVAVLGVGTAAVYLQRQDNAQLRSEIALLRAEVNASTAAAARRAEQSAAAAGPVQATIAPDRAYTPGEEVTTLREEIAALRNSTQDITRLAKAAQAKAALDAHSAVATDLIPVGALKNAGKATPEAAAETLLWAAAGGDVDLLADSIVFTPTARAKADAWFAGLSANTRQQYGTPEKVIALMVAKDAAGFGGMQVLGQRELAPDAVGLRLRFASSEGKTKDDNFLMHRSADGWRLVLPDAALDRFARQLGGR